MGPIHGVERLDRVATIETRFEKCYVFQTGRCLRGQSLRVGLSVWWLFAQLSDLLNCCSRSTDRT